MVRTEILIKKLKMMEMKLKERVERVRAMKRLAIAKLIIPFCLGIAAAVILYLAGQDVYTRYATVFSIYSFMPLGGAIAAIPAGLGLGIHPAGLIAFIVFSDAVVSLFLVWNFDHAKKIPLIGKMVEKVEESGNKALMRYRWAKRFGFVGLVLLVMFPLQWTGSAVGSIVGRLIGMSPLMTWLGVVLGTFIRTTLFTLIYIGVASLF